MLFRRSGSDSVFIGRAHRFDRGAARAAIGQLARDDASMRRLRATLAAEVRDAPVDGLADADVLDRLAALVAQGRLVLVGLRPGPGQVPPLFRDEPPPASEPPPEDQPTAWLEVTLMDDGDPPAPVPGAKYVVELADGTVIEGYLDGEGKARIEGIQEGSAKVSFPDYDAADLKPA